MDVVLLSIALTTRTQGLIFACHVEQSIVHRLLLQMSNRVRVGSQLWNTAHSHPPIILPTFLSQMFEIEPLINVSGIAFDLSGLERKAINNNKFKIKSLLPDEPCLAPIARPTEPPLSVYSQRVPGSPR